MPDWAAILKVIGANGLAVGAVALVLLAVSVWQGCEHRAADRATERLEEMYAETVEMAARWKLNAEKWENAARRCGNETAMLREAARREQEALLQELRVARSAREVSQLQLDALRERVERGELSVRQLLVEVQGL